ncbi:ssl1498 family light-harvesting-like protein [Crocosphaera sp.]|uniref:photosystem II assembly protein Psb34 n=1 Tax=Crocosphaera sp. TaxID=2729996 RepID=UPI002633A80E|nr:ssl1498 family light-harvesting-like protein [Crocosphaera sp.]MDJ0582720.1 ssl1498 family light-harvesting-like protein [Crocosphaera sp.]
MPYTTEEGGRLNNFAAEPKVYEAEPPSASEKRNYIILGVGAVLLIGGLLTVAVYASSNVGVS